MRFKIFNIISIFLLTLYSGIIFAGQDITLDINDHTQKKLYFKISYQTQQGKITVEGDLTTSGGVSALIPTDIKQNQNVEITLLEPQTDQPKKIILKDILIYKNATIGRNTIIIDGNYEVKYSYSSSMNRVVYDILNK